MLDNKQNEYYVYCYMDPRKPGKFFYNGLDFCFLWEPFYIGYGKGNRIKSHFSNFELTNSERIHHNRKKNNKIKKIISNGLLPIHIFLYSNLNKQQATEVEISLISKIGRLLKKDGPLVNISDGGEGGDNIKHLTPKRKKQMYDKIASIRGHKIFQYSINGEYITSHKSISSASRSLKIHKYMIIKCLKNEGYKSAGGFLFRYFKADNVEPVKTYFTKEVLQFDLSGNFISEFKSLKEASDSTGTRMTGISLCCSGKYKYSNGFIWRYKQNLINE